MIEPVFLDVDDVLSLHADQLERYGGLAGIRVANALESAVSTASATFDGEFLHKGLFEWCAGHYRRLLLVAARRNSRFCSL
jgi:death-on-curing protein